MYDINEDAIDDDYDNDYPCDNCNDAGICDLWEASFCCILCRWRSNETNCDDCNRMDI